MNADFGHRSRHETFFADVIGLLGEIRHTRKHLKKWMRPRRAGWSPQFPLARARIHYQPRGVIGIIGPWNVPVLLTLSPLVGAIAAGNRALIKTSEFCPRTAEVVTAIVGQAFTPDEVAVVNGGAEVAGHFSALPFDHLIFTGSTQIGRIVMRAASENLTPVTLELGGKSPTIISDDYPLDIAAGRIAQGKMLNGGQACIAPDYVFVPTGRRDQLVEALAVAVQKSYPTLAGNPDLTWIVNDRHYQRLQAHIADARAKGAQVVPLNAGGAPVPAGERVLPLTVLLGVTDDMSVMQEEIFGPLLPVKTYDDLAEVIAYVNSHPRPLALYHFDDNASRTERVLEQTVSGGACVNDVLFHVAHEGLPFGGVGPSGIGRYHGFDGFVTFSHQKSVLYQSRWSVQSLIRPPYGPGLERVMRLALRWL
ncbi:MAG: Coniferyl aldehyde dehydrogenase [Immundisolibacter sp.]|nr:Coniferyl aldehyde dehydrogenase [Immundisolibacter sp.]